jgi:hypothetical protein
VRLVRPNGQEIKIGDQVTGQRGALKGVRVTLTDWANPKEYKPGHPGFVYLTKTVWREGNLHRVTEKFFPSVIGAEFKE